MKDEKHCCQPWESEKQSLNHVRALMGGFLKSLLCTQQCHYSHWSWTLPGHFGINYRFSLQVLSERASCWLWENKGDTVRKDLINSLLPLDVEKEAQSRKMMGNSYTAGVSRGAGTGTELSTLPVQSIISSTSLRNEDRGRGCVWMNCLQISWQIKRQATHQKWLHLLWLLSDPFCSVRFSRGENAIIET